MAGEAVVDDEGEISEESSQDNEGDMDDEPSQPETKPEFKMPEEKTMTTLKEKIIGFFKHEPEYYWIHYKLEFAALAFFLVCIYYFIDGKNTNANLAITWCNQVVKLIHQEFEHLGCTQNNNYAVM